jgi:hypothetical protein
MKWQLHNNGGVGKVVILSTKNVIPTFIKNSVTISSKRVVPMIINLKVSATLLYVTYSSINILYSYYYHLIFLLFTSSF